MTEWDFDAPQFVDFTQPHVLEEEYNDTWFDTHTEEDDFMLRLSKEGDDDTKARQTKKPKRVLRSTGDTINRLLENRNMEHRDTSDKSPRYLNGKPSRVLVTEKHTAHNNMKTVCPSPKKRQKMSTDDHSVADSSSPAASTRLRRSSSVNCPEAKVFTDDCPAANTRLRTPSKEVQLNSPSNLIQAKYESFREIDHTSKTLSVTESINSSQKVTSNGSGSSKRSTDMPITVKRSQSLKCRMPPNAETAALLKPNKSKLENQGSNSSSKEKLSESELSTINMTKSKTTEELELEKIAAMKRELARTRKLAQESYKKAMSAHGYIPVRSAQPATVTAGFHFKTDERIKKPDLPVQEQKVKEFTKSLRDALPHPALPAKPQVHGVTCPQPFKLTTTKSTSSISQPEKYESLAEQVIAFHKKTPTRFRSIQGKERSRSANKNESSGSGKRLRSQSPKLTVAKTPTLTTRGRSRPVHVLSREEKEQMEFEEHQKQQFKAHPINHKIFEAPSIPRIAPKPTTVVEEFNLYSQKAISTGDLRGTEGDMEEKYDFHARPVDPRILAGPVGVKPVEPKPITIPESPAFALKNRVRIPVDLPKKEEVKESVKLNPVPYAGIPFKPRLAHHYTVPEPFTVEERSKAMLTRREQKIQQILEEEKKAHEFYAQNLPSDSPDQLPPKQVKPATQPEPFHLEIEERGERYQKEFLSKLEEEERAAREMAIFKAGPNHVVHKEPFQPLKSAKPLTERSNFELNTDVRATHREAYDQHLKAREAEVEALKRQREERLEKEQKAAVARMRMEAVHKAAGIRRYKSVTVKPSDKPLTQAQSPRFSQRIRSKHNNSDV